MSFRVEIPVFNLTEYGYKITDETVTDQIIEIGTTEYLDKIYDSKFWNCSFPIHFKKYFPPGNCEFFNCVFRPVKYLQSSIRDNYWEGCRFVGDFRSTHFGNNPEFDGVPTRWPEIALRGCDFSQATMNWCHLSRLELATTTFPLWPSFTIVNPHQNRLVWLNAELPFSQRIIEYIDVTKTDAIMLNWTAMAKRYKYSPSLDPEEVRAALSKLDFVRL